jgi:hypothetical protein
MNSADSESELLFMIGNAADSHRRMNNNLEISKWKSGHKKQIAQQPWVLMSSVFRDSKIGHVPNEADLRLSNSIINSVESADTHCLAIALLMF